MDQFIANRKLFSDKDIETIQNLNILIVGAGGLGGYVINGLVRFGIKKMTIVDMDRYDISNLNRQLFSSHETIGQYKVEAIKKAALKIFPKAIITTHSELVENLEEKLKSEHFDYIVDAVDSIKTRLFLEQLASKMNIPLIHGAIGGWYGQLGVVMPKSELLTRINGKNIHGLEKTFGSPTFAPAIVGSMMVSELIKHALNDKFALENKILYIDLKYHDYHIIYDQSKK